MTVVYQIKNCITRDCYVGSAKNFQERKRRHLKDLRNGKHHSIVLQRAVNKYGIDNFTFIILEKCSLNMLIQREQYWMDKLDPLYNIYKVAGSSLGVKQSVETCAKKRQYAIDNNVKPPDYIWQQLQKPVYMLDYNSLEIIKRFDSIAAACRFINRDSTYGTTITSCCNNKRFSAFGYRWVFNIQDIKILRVKKPLIAWNKGLKTGNSMKKIVHQYTLDGEFLKEWPSVKKAESKFGKGISNCALGKSKSSNGYLWKYPN